MLIPLQEFLYIDMSHERIADQERIVIKEPFLNRMTTGKVAFPSSCS